MLLFREAKRGWVFWYGFINQCMWLGRSNNDNYDFAFGLWLPAHNKAADIEIAARGDGEKFTKAVLEHRVSKEDCKKWKDAMREAMRRAKWVAKATMLSNNSSDAKGLES